MKPVFVSKSRQRSKSAETKVQMAKPRKVLVDRAVYITNPIIWIGKDLNDLFVYGVNFKFNCLWLDNKDLSSLIHAKCLIFSYADMFGRTVQALNFACEYGIPTLWLHRYAPPETAFWNFNIITNEKNPKYFWEVVCHLAI
ncbi:hypothetical protein KAU11_00135 [Candidatus Babeliales bacterium]|nr:hypothetical protein [Candidatus Babeliales bacterium]